MPAQLRNACAASCNPGTLAARDCGAHREPVGRVQRGEHGPFTGSSSGYIESMTLAQAPMTRRVVIAPPTLSLRDAWSAMTRGRFRHLPVVEGGRLLGILSDRDIRLHASAAEDGGLEVPDLRVVDAMTPAPYVCSPDTDVADLVRVMTERKIDAVPVVSPLERLIGLVTTTDLLLLLIRLDEAKVPLPFEFELDAPAAFA